MSDAERPLPPELELAIDAVCLRFEEDWRRGRSPDIEDYLRDLEEPARARAARELQLLQEELATASSSDREASAFPALPTGMPRRIGEYRITRKIGEGGMGCVYEAIQENPRRTVALKVIRGDNRGSSGFRRFRREAHALGQLRHPGIAQIFEAGTGEAHYETGARETISFFVMELVRGKSLKDYANQTGLTPRERLALVRRICDAVQHAHDQGVIHRDLKPANILVEEATTDTGIHRKVGRPKILDFGVARLVRVDRQTISEETSLGGVVGTVPYMSPEQVSGGEESVDARTDVYSLGVVLHELLSGRLPYELSGRSVLDAARVIREEEPVRLSLCDPRYQGDIETIAGKALEKDPNRRYASALEFALDIQRYLDDEPIAARPPSTIYQLGKFARRHRGLVGGILVAFAFLLVGLVGTSWFAVRESRQRRVAERLAIAEGELRNQAQAAETAARTEERKARAVNEFLMGMLEEANPLTNPAGKDLTLLEALNRVVWDPGLFADDPRIEAAVHLTAGRAYLELGDFPTSEDHLRRALSLRLAELGAEHLETAEAHDALGSWHLEKGDLSTARALLLQALQVRERILGKNHATVADSLNNLANLLELQGDLEEAEELHRRALEIRRDRLGDRHLSVTISLNNLGVLLENRGDFDEARDCYEEALRLRTQRLGNDHPRVATSLNNLATLARNEGRYEDARRLFLDALNIRRRVLGEEHPLTALTRNNLGATYLQMGDSAGAEPMLHDALEASQGALAPAQIAAIETNLATLTLRTDRPDEAEELYRSALRRHREAVGDDHLNVSTALLNLGVFLRRRDPGEAVRLHREAVRIREKLLGREHIVTQKMVYALATSLRMADHLEEARSCFAEAVPSLRRDLGDRAMMTEDARTGLLLTLMELSELDEAERLAREIVERQVERRFTRTAVETLIKISRLQERPEEMRRWRTRLRELD